MIRRRLLAAALVALSVAPLSAQDKGTAAPAASGLKPGFNWVLEGGFAFGGEEVVELTFTDGSTQTLTAGQGGQIAFGGQFRLPSAPRLAIGAVIGYKFVTNASENASIGITRVPIEVIGRWTLNQDWWAGIGVTKHLSININGDGFFPDAELESSMAPTLQLGWRWAALTYTVMDYTAENDEVFDASAIGIGFRWVIKPRR